jgi:hypothetical protein
MNLVLGVAFLFPEFDITGIAISSGYIFLRSLSMGFIPKHFSAGFA